MVFVNNRFVLFGTAIMNDLEAEISYGTQHFSRAIMPLLYMKDLWVKKCLFIRKENHHETAIVTFMYLCSNVH